MAEGYVHERRVQIERGRWATRQLVSSVPLRAAEADKFLAALPTQGRDTIHRVSPQVAPSGRPPAAGGPTTPSSDGPSLRNTNELGKTSHHPGATPDADDSADTGAGADAEAGGAEARTGADVVSEPGSPPAPAAPGQEPAPGPADPAQAQEPPLDREEEVATDSTQETLDLAWALVAAFPALDPELRGIPRAMRPELTHLTARWLAAGHTPVHVPYDRPSAIALYLAMAAQAAFRLGKSLPSLTDLGVLGWCGDPALDVEALQDLYAAQLVAIATDTPREAFVRAAEDRTLEFRPADVRWRLVGDETHRASTSRSIRQFFLTKPGPEAQEARQKLARAVEAMEITNVLLYLDGLLTRNYRYPEVPEARRQQLADIVAKGFGAGYTAGQMICFAWRAADTAAGWKERKSLGASEASSATVTVLNSKIDQALEAGWTVPEYEPPRWHQQPLALDTFRELAAAVDRVRDRAVIDACDQCDHLGLRDTDTGPLVRCEHPPDLPRQPEAPGAPVDRHG